VGYKLHTGFSSGNYTQTTDLGNKTAVSVPMQQSGSTYYFVITAYNIAGTESVASNPFSSHKEPKWISGAELKRVCG
jgi:hypothetical protein